MTRVRNSKERVNRKTVISAEEFNATLKIAEQIEDNFFRLRTLALLCLLRLTGKRREEIAMVQLDFVEIDHGFLSVTFELEKKKRRKKICTNCGTVNSRLHHSARSVG